jgi:phage shock protein E
MRLTLLLLAAAWLITGCASHTSSHPQSAAASTTTVIDVRTPEEYARSHVRGSINIPLGELSARIAQVVPDKNSPVIVHCQSGGRSARAKASLDKMGYASVTDLGSLANARAQLEAK